MEFIIYIVGEASNATWDGLKKHFRITGRLYTEQLSMRVGWH
jgi:hypothetical protein